MKTRIARVLGGVAAATLVAGAMTVPLRAAALSLDTDDVVAACTTLHSQILVEGRTAEEGLDAVGLPDGLQPVRRALTSMADYLQSAHAGTRTPVRRAWCTLEGASFTTPTTYVVRLRITRDLGNGRTWTGSEQLRISQRGAHPDSRFYSGQQLTLKEHHGRIPAATKR